MLPGATTAAVMANLLGPQRVSKNLSPYAT